MVSKNLFKDLIDISQLQRILDLFYQTTGLPISLLDLEYNIFANAGTQDFCVKFMLEAPKSKGSCLTFKEKLSSGLKKKDLAELKCPFGLHNIVLPIKMGRKIHAFLFIGQFFYEDDPPDFKYYRELAKDFGFEVDEFLASAKKVPIFPRKKVKTIKESLLSLAQFISSLITSNLELQERIEDQKSTEEALKHTEERLELALKGGDLGVWDWDLISGQIIYNERWAEILGYSLEEINPHENTWRKLVHPDDLPPALQLWNQHLTENKPYYEAEYRMLSKTGDWVWILDCGKVVQWDANGKPIRAAGTHRDITTRKKALLDLDKRLHYEEAVAFCSKELAVSDNLELIIPKILNKLLEVSETSRVVLFENYEDPVDGLCMRLLYEAVAKGIKPHKDIPAVKHLPYKNISRKIIENFNQGKEYGGLVSELPSSDRIILSSLGILSFLDLPVKVDGELCGFIGFDDCKEERIWKKEDLKILKTVASLIGDAISRKKANEFKTLQKDLSEKLSASSNMEETLTSCLNMALKASGLDCGAIYLVKNGAFLEMIVHTGISEKFAKEVAHFASGEPIDLTMTGKPTYAPYLDVKFPDPKIGLDEGLTYVSIIPILYEKKVIACLVAASRRFKKLPVSSRVALETIAAQVSNIIARITASQELKESEEKFHQLFATDLDAVFIFNAEDTKFIEVNEAAEKLYGYTQEEFINLKIADISDEPDKSLEAIHKTLEDKQLAIPIRFHKKKDGTVFPVEISGGTFNFAGQQVIYGVARDITEKLEAEEKIRKSEAIFRSIFDNTGHAIGLINLDNSFRLFNKRAAEMFGYSVEEFSKLKLFDITHPEDLEISRQKRQEIIDGKIDSYLLEKRYLRKNGEVIWVDVSVRPICDAHGKVDFLIGVMVDITKRKKAEERQLLAVKALNILNKPTEKTNIIRELLLLIKESLGIDAVGIRLKEGEDYPYYETNGFSPEFVEMERYLCEQNINGEVIRDARGNPYLECMCGNIISSRTDPSLPFFTKNGSFWTNCTTELLASTTEKERQTRTRNRCNDAGYESVALIPLKTETGIIGLLQLNDKEKNFFNLEMIQFFESLAASIGIAIDKINAQEAIKEQENRLRSIFQASPIGIGLDINREIHIVNEKLCEILGYSREELIGKNSRFVYPSEEEYEHVGKVKYDMLRKYGFATVETKLKRKDGEIIDVILSSSALDRDNLSAGVTFTVLDITERKKIVEALKESEQRFRLAAESASDLIYEWDIATGYLDWHGDIDSVLGFVSGEFPRTLKAWVDRIYPEDRKLIEEGIKHWKESPDPIYIEYRILKKDGSVLYWMDRGKIILDEGGKPSKVIGACTDITKRKQAEQALRESEKLFRNLFENSLYGIVIEDTTGRFLDCNRSFQKITGYSLEELREKTFRDITPEKWLNLQAEIHHNQLLVRGYSDAYEKEYIRKDGSLIPIEVTSYVIKDEYGEPIRFWGVVQDLTEAKKAEAEKNKLEEQLRQALKMEAIGLLAGGIAHDFNNLLSPIIGYSEMALEQFQHQLPAVQPPFYNDLKTIREVALRASELTHQLLAFSRKQILEIKVINLNEVIENVAKMLGRIIGEDVDLKINLAPDLANVKVDTSQMHQVLMNLAVNARDAMPHGGKLIIETENVDLDEEYAKTHADAAPGAYVVLAISDNGCGMSSETLTHIFEPFFTTKERGRGTGLGLSMIYGIVKQHKGYIWAYSELGKGSTFKIYLPQVEEKDVTKEEVSEIKEEKISFADLTVLVVEDDLMVRELACNILESNGFHTLAPENTEAALTLAKEFAGEIHLLLTDIIMPKMNGKELYQRLSADLPKLKVLYMSGYTYEVIAQQGFLEPGTKFLQKPFTVKNFLQKIQEALQQ